MLAPQITNHVAQALGRLLYQYQGQPRITGMITAFAQQIQDLEDGLYPICSGNQIWDGTSTPAVGAALDDIGTIVGIARNGLDDAQYTLVIFGKIAENFSQSTLTNVESVIGFLFQAQQVLVQQIYPAALCVEVLAPAIPASLYPLATQLVENSMGAGIRLVISGAPVVGVFRFAGSGVGPQNGFGNGTFVGLISQ